MKNTIAFDLTKLKPYQLKIFNGQSPRFSFARGNDARKGGTGLQPLSDDCGREIFEFSAVAAISRAQTLVAKYEYVAVLMTDTRNHTAVIVASKA